ncbi:hypothetical protein KXR64_16455 [Brucella intermedia]|uniref:hypothetical protein n=1 Tax=Brucella TaxID=234 RepID=UPI0009464DE1|nr:hypothetical protein [Brucella intermedia]
MKLFSKEIMIAATVYIQAEDEEEAQAKYDELVGDTMEISGVDGAGPTIYGGMFHDAMPEVSLSPAMTIHGPFPDDDGFELVEEELEPGE